MSTKPHGTSGRVWLSFLIVTGLLAASAGVGVGAGAGGAAQVEPAPQGLAERLPALMAGAAVPGAQIALVEGGAVAWHRAFGVANTATNAPVTDDSIFEAASLSKPVFAYAVLKLADAGRLDLDTPLVTYLPGPYDVRDDDRLGRITARHVLSHQTGFPNWRPGGQPLAIHFAPGERFSYSGEGFVYLAAVVERITGETLEAFMKRSVFDPLGMAASSYVWQSRYDTLKVYNHGTIGDVAGRNRSWRANAAASLHTTARDYATFVAAVLGGVGLKESTARQLAMPQSRPDEAGFNTVSVAPTGRHAASLAWGLGWGLEQDGTGWTLWHWGDNGPTKAFVMASPARRSGLVVFLNSQNGLTIMPALLGKVPGAPTSGLDWLRIRELPAAFGPFAGKVRQGRVSEALSEYRENKARPGSTPLDEDMLNGIGYALLRDQKTKDAIEVFQQNVTDHPDSWNVHDSLGEALAADGQTELAIKAYERSLELNPASSSGAEALKQLRERRIP